MAKDKALEKLLKELEVKMAQELIRKKQKRYLQKLKN